MGTYVKKVSRLTFGAVLALSLHVSPANAGGYVGATQTTALGNLGYAELSRLCAAQYTDARMCTSEEFLETVHNSGNRKTHAAAYVRYTPAPALNSTSVYDASGVVGTPGQMTCGGWSRTDTTTLTVTGSGRFALASCASPRSVTCCR